MLQISVTFTMDKIGRDSLKAATVCRAIHWQDCWKITQPILAELLLQVSCSVHIVIFVEVSQNRGTPSSHPFSWDFHGFSNWNYPAIGEPPFMETSLRWFVLLFQCVAFRGRKLLVTLPISPAIIRLSRAALHLVQERWATYKPHATKGARSQGSGWICDSNRDAQNRLHSRMGENRTKPWDALRIMWVPGKPKTQNVLVIMGKCHNDKFFRSNIVLTRNDQEK